MAKGILGIRHVTATADEAEQNMAFYAHLLGLRLVKITVNFDDPGSYHVYYGHSSGHLGTILTFFVWPGARRGRVGNSKVTATSFSIPSGAGQYWRDRLQTPSTDFEPLQERLGESVIAFADQDDLRLELIETNVADRNSVWEGSDEPADAAIHVYKRN